MNLKDRASILARSKQIETSTIQQAPPAPPKSPPRPGGLILAPATPVEEFANPCHDENGRFCETAGAGGGPSGEYGRRWTEALKTATDTPGGSPSGKYWLAPSGKFVPLRNTHAEISGPAIDRFSREAKAIRVSGLSRNDVNIETWTPINSRQKQAVLDHLMRWHTFIEAHTEDYDTYREGVDDATPGKVTALLNNVNRHLRGQKPIERPKSAQFLATRPERKAELAARIETFANPYHDEIGRFTSGSAAAGLKRLDQLLIKNPPNKWSEVPIEKIAPSMTTTKADNLPQMWKAINATYGLGLIEKDRSKLPIKEVSTDSLRTTQTGIDVDNLRGILTNLGKGAESIQGTTKDTTGEDVLAVHWGAANYVLDGHHRAVASILAGNKRLKVRYVDVNPVTASGNPYHDNLGRFTTKGGGGGRTIPVTPYDDEDREFERVAALEKHYGRKEMAPEMAGPQWAFVGFSPEITGAAVDVLDGVPYDPSGRYSEYGRDTYKAAETILKTLENESSDVVLFSGHHRSREEVDSMLNEGVDFPLVATSPDKNLANAYAGKGTKTTPAVVFEFEPGSQAGFYQANEHIATGEYEVTDHKWNANQTRVDIQLRQTKRNTVPEKIYPDEED